MASPPQPDHIHLSYLLQELAQPVEFTVGWAQSHGNRQYQDDRCVEFVLPLPTGGSALVWAVSAAAAAAAAAAAPACLH